MQHFEGKTAVVTGAASGIGRALAEQFAEARMNVVLADIEEAALNRAVQELQDQQHRVIGVQVNTMLRDSVQALADRAIAEFGNVHVLCNNAGVLGRNEGVKPVWDLPAADWDWLIGVNFFGVLYGLQAFVPHMLAHGEEGHIVNTASLAAWLPGGGPYGVTKHGVLALSESLYSDLKARDAHIGASVLCPGWVDTKLATAERNRPAELDSGGGAITGGTAGMASTMLKTGKQPAEISEIVFDAIKQNNFYILPHPAWDYILRARFEAALARGLPARLDFADMMKRQAAGDRF